VPTVAFASGAPPSAGEEGTLDKGDDPSGPA
jgi:hypothetical protein